MVEKNFWNFLIRRTVFNNPRNEAQADMMKKIYTYGGQPATRKLTIYDLKQKTGRRKYTQVTASTAIESRAAEAAGIDILSCNAGSQYDLVRMGAPYTMIIAGLPPLEFVSDTELLRGAIKALSDGADAIYCTRSLAAVEILAKNDIPVMSHLGLQPRKSTLVGGLRAIGKTADEAMEEFQKFQRLQDAGAFGVEVELMPDEFMQQVSDRLSLVTFSIGAGQYADVILSYMEDILGETEIVPRHSKQYGELRHHYKIAQDARIDALRAYACDVATGGYPGASHSLNMAPGEKDKFLSLLDSRTSS